MTISPSTIALAITAITTLALASCSDNDPEPEIQYVYINECSLSSSSGAFVQSSSSNTPSSSSQMPIETDLELYIDNIIVYEGCLEVHHIENNVYKWHECFCPTNATPYSAKLYTSGGKFPPVGKQLHFVMSNGDTARYAIQTEFTNEEIVRLFANDLPIDDQKYHCFKFPDCKETECGID